jgi:ATP-binding protein involved in chromosome partitioning
MPLPVAIEALGKPQVRITWEDDAETVTSPKDLRAACGCAFCIDEMTGIRTLDPATIPEDIVVTGIELIGQYAMAVRFSDGHQTGIYGFAKLREAARPPTHS